MAARGKCYFSNFKHLEVKEKEVSQLYYVETLMLIRLFPFLDPTNIWFSWKKGVWGMAVCRQKEESI